MQEKPCILDAQCSAVALCTNFKWLQHAQQSSSALMTAKPGLPLQLPAPSLAWSLGLDRRRPGPACCDLKALIALHQPLEPSLPLLLSELLLHAPRQSGLALLGAGSHCSSCWSCSSVLLLLLLLLGC